jgi:CRISPR-associated protein Csm5
MTLTLYLKTVCPVHIGCDEDYEPTGFMIDEALSELISFDPIDFIKTLSESDRKKFSEICAKGTVESRLEIMKFMAVKKMNKGKRVKATNGFINHYKDKLKLAGDKNKIRNELNSFTIARTIFNPNTNQPYIPGSSIKGALRTAWLNKMQKAKNLAKVTDARKEKDLQKNLLDGGSFETDPFRLVKVSDFMPVGVIQTRISYAINRKKNPGKASNENLSQILEVIVPGTYFKGTLTVDDAPAGSRIINPVELQTLMNSATRFYADELKKENNHVSRIGANQCELREIPEGGFLICLGRHTGAEAVTIEGHRSIKIKGPRNAPPLFLPSATTIWLAASESNPAVNTDLTPFGWVTFQKNEPSADELSEPVYLNEDKNATAEPPEPAYKPVEKETLVWEKAALSWSPGDQKLSASFEGKKAACTGKALLTEKLVKKVIGKRKPATAKVTVEKEGNLFKILKIEEQP